ncbi:hypothetical protein SYNPS1DRAFT_29797 [Syncephalis pseudoplumigaleata]|uniref:DNA-binding protein RAP1 n=1 Tax=Syncephalis pseudoplumigaleata TaxID=1712513 RepID=A0A4P9YX66_9FUNG|nr:hypothetical protein SYNPS1DRAFT_29797 [Syncephalis pseudoplumigaleata]|eukprot:RKP24445.1 hypothetical protein SYNPS1DRAFT_29797 [Syncephalis pseudoplumigaleata]
MPISSKHAGHPAHVSDEEKLAALRVIKRLRDETGVAGREVLAALTACSGQVGLTRRYLRLGAEACADFAWTAEEDRLLLDGADAQAIAALEKRHGQQSVEKRTAFLEQLSNFTSIV